MDSSTSLPDQIYVFINKLTLQSPSGVIRIIAYQN
jgi:hypothetical protein